MKIWRIIYLISAVLIGYGCLMALLFIIFNVGSGFLSRDNKPAAILVGIIAITGVSVFLSIGRKIFQSNDYIPLTIGIILLSMFLIIPVFEVIDSIKDSIMRIIG